MFDKLVTAITTPAILYILLIPFVGSLLGYALYELYAIVTRKVPTISAIITPQIHSHYLLAIGFGVIFIAFNAFLVWDWFLQH